MQAQARSLGALEDCDNPIELVVFSTNMGRWFQSGVILMTSRQDATVHNISIVVPVYQGELTFESLLAEIKPLTTSQPTPSGAQFHVSEVVLVHDGAIDGSDTVMLSLAASMPFVTTIWLSRNFGQHPATLAGMSSTNGDWVVTLDEDGQHAPRDIAKLLDVAVENGVQLVYAQPANEPPHGPLRNSCSAVAKWAFKIFSVMHISASSTAFGLSREILRADWRPTADLMSTWT